MRRDFAFDSHQSAPEKNVSQKSNRFDLSSFQSIPILFANSIAKFQFQNGFEQMDSNDERRTNDFMILSFCLLLIAIVKSKRVGVGLIRLIFALPRIPFIQLTFSLTHPIMDSKKLSKFKQANVLRIICFMQQITYM